MSKYLLLVLLPLTLFALPETPWAKAEREKLPPGEPGKDFTPIVMPNGKVASYKIVEGVKVFHLTAAEITWEVAKGLTIKAWGLNGSVPGPTLEVAEGDKVRIYVTNHLPAPTTIHWHGVLLPCGMDGVSGLTQPAIPPGETYRYEFYFPDSGTFMYHPHHDTMIQEGMGLTGMIIVHKREPDVAKRPDRDFAIMLQEWNLNVGTSHLETAKGGGFNLLTMNGKVMPATEPLVAKLGDTIWIRYGNLSAMDHHPIHLHGYSFKIIGSDGGWAPDKSVLMPETTVLVPTGAAKVIELYANNPGDWIFHCHMTHHIVNQMGEAWPKMLGIEMGELEEQIRELIPGYKTIGVTGMKDMTKSGLPIVPNSIPMLGFEGQFGGTVLGGMANILRVREHLDSYEDPGPYHFPKELSTRPATPEELEADGIKVKAAELMQ